MSVIRKQRRQFDRQACHLKAHLPDGLIRYFVASGNELAGQLEGVVKPAGEHRAQAFLSPPQTACQQRRLPSGQGVHAHLGTSNTGASVINKVPAKLVSLCPVVFGEGPDGC